MNNRQQTAQQPNWTSPQELLGGLGGYLGWRGSKDPSQEYQKYSEQGIDAIRQGTDRATGYLNPYRTAGENALGRYMGMLSGYENPKQMYDNIMGGWQMSSGNQNKLSYALDKLKNERAARGLTNSGQEFQDIANTTSDYANQDQHQYLQDILGIGNTALSGYGGLTNLGSDAAARSGQFQMSGAGDTASLLSAIARAREEEAKAQRETNAGFGSGMGSFIGGVPQIASTLAGFF